MSRNIIAEIAEELEVTQVITAKVIAGFVSKIMELVALGERVKITGLGIFEQKIMSSRVGVNPSTGEKIIIREKHLPKFKPSKNFKDLVAKVQ